MKFMNNVKESFFSSNVAENEVDQADLVQTILIVAGFAIVTILAVNWIGTAVLNKGADVAGCIEGSSTYNASSSAENCKAQDHSSTNSFTNDTGYSGRYGG